MQSSSITSGTSNARSQVMVGNVNEPLAVVAVVVFANLSLPEMPLDAVAAPGAIPVLRVEGVAGYSTNPSAM